MKILHVTDDPTDRYVLLAGPGVGAWLREARIPAVRSPMHRGYRLHRDRLPDTLAAAQEAGVTVRIRESTG